MSTIKFVYRSQNIPDNIPIEGSHKTITSGAVYTAINNIQMDTLFKSGYLPEGIASAVSQHFLTYTNNTLTLGKNSNLFIPNGIIDGVFEFTKITTTEDISNSATYSDNMDAYVFCDTAENKLIARTKRNNTISAATGEPQDRAIQQVWAQLDEPTVAQDSTSEGVIWWDLNENFIKVYNSSSATWEVKQYSIPICIVSSENRKITGIAQNFITSGVCGNITWVNPGVSFVIPTGTNNENGTFTNEILETTEVICKIILTDINNEFTDYVMYINLDGEIEGPTEEYTFDNTTGVFIDETNVSHKSCKYATISAKHLTSANKDPLTVTDYTARPTLTLADNDDIEYVIKLIGSSMGITIDDLQAEINAATADREKIRQEMADAIKAAKEEVSADMHHVMVHRQLPEGFTENVLNPDIKLDETIYGTKTFVNTIIGNITGTAQNVKISQTSGEIIPSGLTSFNPNGENDLQSANTDVRIGSDYVSATTFKGVSTYANWADLAEMYETDKEYEIGTLLKWGGTADLTLANFGVCNAVVSDKPGILMNSEGKGQPIALAGRVKVRVLGKVKKHDAIVLNEMAPGIGKVQENASETIIARALENNEFVGEKLVLCVVKFTL